MSDIKNYYIFKDKAVKLQQYYQQNWIITNSFVNIQLLLQVKIWNYFIIYIKHKIESSLNIHTYMIHNMFNICPN